MHLRVFKAAPTRKDSEMGKSREIGVLLFITSSCCSSSCFFTEIFQPGEGNGERENGETERGKVAV